MAARLEVGSDEESRTAGAKRQQKNYTAFLHNEQPPTLCFAPRLNPHRSPV